MSYLITLLIGYIVTDREHDFWTEVKRELDKL